MLILTAGPDCGACTRSKHGVAIYGLLQILSATTPKLVWRFFGSWIRTVQGGGYLTQTGLDHTVCPSS